MPATLTTFIDRQRGEMEDFWSRQLQANMDFSSLNILPPPAALRRPRLLVVPQDIATSGKPVDALMALEAAHGKVRSKEISDATVFRWERHPRKGSYAIWMADSAEPEENTFGLTADAVLELKVPTATLIEVLVHDLFTIHTEGAHANRSHITYCTGSLRTQGDAKVLKTPVVDFLIDELFVNWYDTNLRPIVDKYGARRVYPAIAA